MGFAYHLILWFDIEFYPHSQFSNYNIQYLRIPIGFDPYVSRASSRITCPWEIQRNLVNYMILWVFFLLTYMIQLTYIQTLFKMTRFYIGLNADQRSNRSFIDPIYCNIICATYLISLYTTYRKTWGIGGFYGAHLGRQTQFYDLLSSLVSRVQGSAPKTA